LNKFNLDGEKIKLTWANIVNAFQPISTVNHGSGVEPRRSYNWSNFKKVLKYFKIEKPSVSKRFVLADWY